MIIMSLLNQKIGYVIVIVLLLGQNSFQQSIRDSNKEDLLCQKKTYKTTETRCTIVNSSCQIGFQRQEKFQSCTISNCQRNLTPSNCQRSLQFPLTQKQCYWKCCKSDIFDPQSCESFNKTLQKSHQTQDNVLILVLAIVSGSLLVFTLIFFLKILRCKDVQKNKTLNEDNEEEFSKENQIKWINSKYFDVKCDICLQYGSMIITPCNHAFHEKCYFENVGNQNVTCPKCPQKIIEKLKVVCTVCRQKQFKLKFASIWVLKQIIHWAKTKHQAECQKNGTQNEKQVCTDIRLTSTESD